MARESSNIEAISDAFTTARAQGRALATFPGDLPETLKEAYAIQDRAISLWPDTVGGWKIGLVPPQFRDAAGADRLVGPIFARQIVAPARGVLDMAVFESGFAAVEAEFVFRLKGGLPDDADITPAAAAGIVESLHIGVEIASSPFAGINDLGPMSVVSDFGNNNGLIVGPAIPDWRERDPADLPARVTIDGETVGEASAAGIPGGPIGALCFLIALCRTRGVALKAGDYISTGAATGVHEAPVGAGSVADFGPFGAIKLRLVPAGATIAHKVTA